VTELLHWGGPGFPEKQLAWRRARSAVEYAQQHRGFTALAGVAAITLVAALSLGIAYIRHDRLAAADHETITRTESANADLQDALARLRDQLGAASQALSQAQGRVAALSDEARRQLASSEQAVTSKADRVAQLSHALEQAQRELHLAEAQRVTLMARLSKAEADLAEGLARQQQAQAGFEQWQKKIQQLTAERDKAASERDQLRARVGELEKHSLMRSGQPAQPVAQAQPAPAAPAPAAVASAAAPPPAAAVAPPPTQVAVVQPPRAAPAVATSSSGLAQFERVLASAGVDVAHLFAQYGMHTGEGGPFIPAPRGAHPDPGLSREKLAALESLVKVLPVSAPLASYEIGSRFGMRGDPINGRAALHTGIDFRAPYMSPVYATAPGVVTFSGYRDDYGKVVEIDHGHGIATRYAHLHRATVSVGQRVAAHSQIGFLGSSGRATGPHVHYEVVVNGEPQDPEKFLSLARLVPVAQR
jgi:murein DD-endopeptidase MepM/ murein hydrolase activator NlpD